MKYTQTYTDIFLKEKIKQGFVELTNDFDKSILEMELCMDQFHIGLKECRKKHLNNTHILWNYAGFVNMCAMELKIYMKSIFASTNEWEMRTHIKTSYLLIHTFYETYDIIQKDYRKLSYHNKIGDDFALNLRTLSESIKNFRKQYLKNINIIRNNIIAHLNSDLSYHISTMETFQLSQTIETLLEFGNLLNEIGYLLKSEVKFVTSNLANIK